MVPRNKTLFCAYVFLALALPIGLPPLLPAQLSPDQSSVLESTRASALKFAEHLPDFICTQVTHRRIIGQGQLVTGASGSGGGVPQGGSRVDADDVIEERLTYIGGNEKYEVLKVNGRRANGIDHMKLQGMITTGEFGTALHEIFDPDSHTTFSWDRKEYIDGQEVYVYAFHVPQEHGWEVVTQDPGGKLAAPYSGRIYVDPQAFTVLRVTSALEFPRGFSILHSERMIEYKQVTIANKEYLLPSHSEVRAEDRLQSYVNEVDFKDYHKFGAESTVHYEGEAPGKPD